MAPMLLSLLVCLVEVRVTKDWPPTQPNPHRADPPPDTLYEPSHRQATRGAEEQPPTLATPVATKAEN